ncbi:hypothetical protein ACFLVF_01965 [Chloroflexota bacterium]
MEEIYDNKEEFSFTCIKESETGRSAVGYARLKKARRFYVRCRDGILVAGELGYRVRWFCLSESDYALGEGLDFPYAVHLFERKLRRDYGKDIGFLWVEHLQGTKQRSNRHFVQWGERKLDLGELDEYWQKVYGSFLLRGRYKVEIKSAEETARYLSKYVAGEGFVKARFSYNWVFPGWFDFSRWVKRQYEVYPSITELAELSRMSQAERSSNSRYLEWILSSQERRKQLLADKVLGMSENEKVWMRGYNRKHRRKLKVF